MLFSSSLSPSLLLSLSRSAITLPCPAFGHSQLRRQTAAKKVRRGRGYTLPFLRHVRSGQQSVCLILILFNKLLHAACCLLHRQLLSSPLLLLLLHFLCDVTSAAVSAGLQDSLSPNCTIMPGRTGEIRVAARLADGGVMSLAISAFIVAAQSSRL